eukprot:96327-Amorphochlora_amoeboformis.AAC.1
MQKMYMSIAKLDRIVSLGFNWNLLTMNSPYEISVMGVKQHNLVGFYNTSTKEFGFYNTNIYILKGAEYVNEFGRGGVEVMSTPYDDRLGEALRT